LIKKNPGLAQASSSMFRIYTEVAKTVWLIDLKTVGDMEISFKKNASH